MRSRIGLLAAALPAFVLLAPFAAHATGVPFLGPIVPSDVQQCAAGWGAVITIGNNLIAFVITILLIFVTPAMIVWAGFLYVFSPTNPSMRSKANSILKNTAIGIGFALGAWLIVDLLLTSLHTVTDTGAAGGVQSFTQALFQNTGDCLFTPGTQFNQAVGETPGAAMGACADGSAPTNGSCGNCTVGGGCDYTLAGGYSCSGGGTFDSTTGQCTVCTDGPDGGCSTSSPAPTDTQLLTTGAGGACDPSVVQQGAAAGGYTLTNAQANTLSCIAQNESSCGVANLNYKWGQGSSAAGAWQVLMQTNGNCYNNAACESAVGASGPLNCSSGFSGGNPIAGSSVVQTCVKAAANTNCSAAAAACLLQANNGSFSAWSNFSAKNAQCVNG